MEEGAVKPFDVKLRVSETTQDGLRDFRWLSKCDAEHPHSLPNIKLPNADLCFQPIFWHPTPSTCEGNTYSMTVPPPMHKGRYQGVYAEVVFPKFHPADNLILDLIIPPDEVSLTSVGWVTPDTYPFDDCTGEECTNTLL